MPAARPFRGPEMKDWLSGIVPSELLRRVGSKRRARQEDVEDAIQDVLLGILQKLRSDSPPPAPLRPDAYLVQAVHNRLTSMQRSDWRQVVASDDGTMLEETPHPQLEPADFEVSDPLPGPGDDILTREVMLREAVR